MADDYAATTSEAGAVTSLDGTWQIIQDLKKEGEGAGWSDPAKFPTAQSKPAHVPGVPNEEFPITAWWTDPPTDQFWYERTFSVPNAPAPHMRYYLRFGAVRYTSDFWLNGTHLGTHGATGNADGGGEDPFEFDVTKLLQVGKPNTIIVLAKMNLLGGIWQRVSLVAQPDVRIIDAFAKPDAKAKKMDLEVRIENNSGAPAQVGIDVALGTWKPAHSLLDQSTTLDAGPGISTAKLTLPVEQPHLWNLDDPFLYTLKIASTWKNAGGQITGHDVDSFRTGFRDFRMVNDYWTLNGHRIILASAHGNQYDPVYGVGSDGRMEYYYKELDQLKKAGFNTMRCIVAAAMPEQLDYADEHGMLYFCEHETSWLIHDPALFGRSLNQVVRRDRNHPSLALWGFLNETDNLDIYAKGKAWLPQVRAIDDTRPILLSSGRWDKDYKTASLSNTGSQTWDTYMGGEDPVSPKNTSPDESVGGAFHNGTGDAHIYTSYPTSWDTYTKFIALAKDTKPFFLSEAGIGTSYNPIPEAAEMKRLNAPSWAYSWYWINRGLDGMKHTWSTYGLAATYPDMNDMMTDSDLSATYQRAMTFSMFRGNPHINGYNLTSIEDFWGGAEGIMDNFRNFKPGHLKVMQEGWAPLRWCLAINPTNAYAGQDLNVRVDLANLDVLPAGDQAATISIKGAGGVVWTQKVTAHIQADGPLAYNLFNDKVTIPADKLSAGKYTLEAKLDGHANAAASIWPFTVTSRATLPKIAGDVTVAGVPQNVKDLLTTQGAKLHDYAPGEKIDKETIVVGGDFKGGAKEWRGLYNRAAQGAHLVFYNENVFRLNDAANKWLAVASKGNQNGDPEWLYHKDTVAKTGSPAFAGMPAKLMEPMYYGQLMNNAHFFQDATVPDETQAVAIRSTLGNKYEYKDGFMIGTYRLGAGKFTVNAFDIQGTIGSPATDRLLLNLVTEAQKDAAPVAALPADFDATLDKLGITDPPPAPAPTK